MEITPITPESLSRAAQIIRGGGIVAFPTETVYGLGADAYNPAALVKIFEAKGRPRFDPLIIHIAAVETLENVANLSLLNEETRKKLFLLAENLWPGPLSIVLPKSEKIPGIATAGLSTAAIRFPAHETAQKLISLCGGAVAAPSANPFGSLSPTRAEHVRDRLGDKVDMILDGGPAQIGVESTVLDITGDEIRILRHGGTPREVIEEIIGKISRKGAKIAEDAKGKKREEEMMRRGEEGGFVSPGQLRSHYAPRTPLVVLSREEIIKQQYIEGCAYLFFDEASREAWQARQKNNYPLTKVLSQAGKTAEAAASLFETLHELDKKGCTRIYAQLAPEEGLGAAINDRLTRASA